MTLKEWRQKTGFSQKEIGELIGVSRFQISHLESGDRFCSLEMAKKIEDLSGGMVKIRELVNPKRVEESVSILGLKEELI